MATSNAPNDETPTNSQGGVARSGWSVGTRATMVLAALTVVLAAAHLWWSIPVWPVWVAGGLTLAAFVVALIRRAHRSAELEDDLY